MDFAAAARQPRQSVLLWVGCGALLAMGACLAVSAATAATNLHVQVQPAIQARVGFPAAGRAPSGVALRTDNSAPMALTAAAPAAAAAATAAAGGAAAPLLSWAAIIVSLAAALFTFWKRGQATAEPVYVPVATAAPAPVPAPTYDPKSNKMDEVALTVKAELARRKSLTPKQVILDLQRGNARFWSGTPDRPEMNAIERRASIIGQAPTVAILSCADSRVPVEIVFDQGLGSVFVVRVAGNILDPTAMGSLEFAVKYLGAKVILVMGHEGCGAVKGAMSMSNADLDQQPAYLQGVLRSIKGNLDLGRLSKIQDNRAQDREAVVVNTSAQVRALQKNPLIAERIANGSVMVAGAFYEITSGIVDFFTLDKNGLVTDV